VLYTGKDFVIIDFEGEPARPIGERRIKRSPLKDVAVMLRSFGQPYQAMLPAIAVDTLHSGATGLGIPQSAAGCGAVIGALFIASSAGAKRRGQLQLRMLLLSGACLVLFGLSRWLLVSVPMIFGIGLASMAYNSLNQAFLQSNGATAAW
jgi:hypothetical protein